MAKKITGNKLLGQFFGEQEDVGAEKTEIKLAYEQKKEPEQIRQVLQVKPVKLAKQVKQVKIKPITTKRTFLVEDEVWADAVILMKILEQTQAEFINGLIRSKIEEVADKIEKFKKL
jgi:hypothetical protein